MLQVSFKQFILSSLTFHTHLKSFIKLMMSHLGTSVKVPDISQRQYGCLSGSVVFWSFLRLHEACRNGNVLCEAGLQFLQVVFESLHAGRQISFLYKMGISRSMEGVGDQQIQIFASILNVRAQWSFSKYSPNEN